MTYLLYIYIYIVHLILWLKDLFDYAKINLD
jgi:hypothetical protein